MKPIEQYTMDELSTKIESIKAEREKMAKILKQYEEELEARKNKNWLPLKEEINFTINKLTLDTACIEIKAREGFYDEDSFYKYLSALKTTRKAWFANAKGEPIDIKVLLPLLKKGWVAMDKSGDWYWYSEKPKQYVTEYAAKNPVVYLSASFNLKRADDWKTSLQECGF